MNQISPNKLIARGRTADVYEWDAGHVLKIFHDWFERGNIEYEQRIALAVHASGVKSPVAGEIIQVDGHTGLIYERVAGESMGAMCLRKPWKAFTYAKVLAQLHAQMHNCHFQADVPAQRSRIQSKINDAQALPAVLKTRLLSAADELPEGDRVCHGDFHPENVLVSDKESTVIDWIDSSRGNPLADVARTTVILIGSAESGRNPFLRLFIKAFHAAYLKEYFRLRPGGEDEYHRWMPIVAAARLSENIVELENWLVRQAQKGST
jgi:uncharacterized protein (TIGR02172 family)